MDLKVLRKLNMRRRISCSRAASKYCWGVKYGMVFFLEAKIRWMVGGCQAQNGRFVFFWGGFWGWILGMWAGWDEGDKKVGRRGCEG